MTPPTDRTPVAGILPPAVSNVRFANSLLGFVIESARVGPRSRRGMLSTIMKPLKNNHVPLGASQIQTHKPSRRCVAVVCICPCAFRRGTRHERDVTHGEDHGPAMPSHTRCTRGTGRAEAYEAGFVVRVVVVASSSARPVGCSGITRNKSTTRKRSAPPRNATNSDLESSASELLRTCLVAFFHCGATAGRPGGREHFLVWGVPVRPWAGRSIRGATGPQLRPMVGPPRLGAEGSRQEHSATQTDGALCWAVPHGDVRWLRSRVRSFVIRGHLRLTRTLR